VTSGKSEAFFRASRAHQEGRLADRHERWTRDAVDACHAQDERMEGGRRSRSVLIPRRWYQVGDNALALRRRRRQESPVSGETTKETVKPSRRECRTRFGDLWWTYSYAFFICMRGCGCGEASGIPCALCFLRDNDRQSSGEVRREKEESWPSFETRPSGRSLSMRSEQW
jgi:hypothetical protein